MSTPHLALPDETTGRAAFKVLGIRIEWAALRAVVLAYVATRLMLFLVILLSMTLIPMRPGPFLFASPDNLLLDGLVRFDSWWYHNIITSGYHLGDPATGRQGNVAFFPLYPLLVGMVAALTGDVFLSGVLISNIAFLISLCYIYALTRPEFGDEAAARTVFYVAAAPTAIFFAAMYTESLFVALVAATFYHSRNGQWGWAALAGMLAAATRNTGVILAAVVALEGLHQQGVRFWPAGWGRARILADLRQQQVGALLHQAGVDLLAHLRRQVRLAFKGWRWLAAAACVPLGLLAYMAYLAHRVGDPLAFIRVQAAWGRNTSPTALAQLSDNVASSLAIGNVWLGQFNPQVLLEILMLLIFLPLVIAVACKLRPAHTLFAALTLLVPISTGTTGSMNRYILMLIPCFMVLGHWGRRPSVERLVLSISLPLMAYSTILFSHWYFAG